MTHAEFLAAFFAEMLAGGVPAEFAGPAMLQVNEAVCNGTIGVPAPSKADQEQAIADAAAAKAARRAEETP